MPQGHTPLNLFHFWGQLWSALFTAFDVLRVTTQNQSLVRVMIVPTQFRTLFQATTALKKSSMAMGKLGKPQTCFDRTGIEIRKTGFQEVVQISELIAIGLIPNNSDPGDGPVPSPTVTEAEDATIAASAIVDYAQRQLASGPFSTCYHHR